MAYAEILEFVNHHESDPETLRALAIAVVGKLGRQGEVKALAEIAARGMTHVREGLSV